MKEGNCGHILNIITVMGDLGLDFPLIANALLLELRKFALAFIKTTYYLD